MFLNDLKNKLQKTPSLFIGEKTAFRSAVLIPLTKIEGKWQVVFQVRSLSMRKQPGDISFPGGRVDTEDATLLDAALRETKEELGVDPETVEIVEALSPYITSPSFVVYPFVGVIQYDEIIPGYNREEVEEVFTIPLDWLLQYEPYMHLVSMTPRPSADFPFEKITNGSDYEWGTRAIEEWFYDYKNYTVWGLTARILKHFIEKIK